MTSVPGKVTKAFRYISSLKGLHTPASGLCNCVQTLSLNKTLYLPLKKKYRIYTGTSMGNNKMLFNIVLSQEFKDSKTTITTTKASDNSWCLDNWKFPSLY